MRPFVCTALPGRVVFGSGTLASLSRELDALGCSRALVLSTRFQKPLANEVSRQLGTHSVGVFAEEMHTPIEVTERAVHLPSSL
jgi:maleylacetate reductase